MYCSVAIGSFAQEDIQCSVLTDDGIITISKTCNGNDAIMLNIQAWDAMVKGTKYESANLCAVASKKACLEISNKTQNHCRSGIGFRCGIFDCNGHMPGLVNKENRICAVDIQKQDAFTIRIIFLDKVDWISLRDDH
jgi:hypothetical protein